MSTPPYQRLRTFTLVLALIAPVALASAPAAAQSAKDKKIQKKTAPYIDAINSLSKTVFGKRFQYTKRLIDWDKGPSCDPKADRAAMYPFQKGYLKGWSKALAKANKRSPKMKKLEAAAKSYIKGLKALEKPWAKAVEYYRAKKHHTDNCKKAKAYHAAIAAAFVHISAGDRAMRAEVDAIQEARADKVVKDIAKKYGKRIRYHHRKGMIDAKRAVVAFEKAWKSSKPDITGFKAHIDVVQALEASAAAVVKTQRSDASRTGFSNFARSYKNFLKALNEGLARMDGSKPFTERENERMKSGKGSQPRGSYSAVIKSFNALVSVANRMRYGRGVK